MNDQIAFFVGMAISFVLARTRAFGLVIRALPTITLSLIAGSLFVSLNIPPVLLAAMVGGSLMVSAIHLFAIQAMRAMEKSGEVQP